MAAKRMTEKEALASLRLRLDQKIDSSGGPDACWPWTGATNPTGYGVIGVLDLVSRRSQTRYAHRVVFELATGESPEVVRHKCDNPSCCNLDHLVAGTRLLNNLDAAARGRAVQGERSHFSVLTEEQVVEIRRRAAAKESSRSLAKEYQVADATIQAIVRRRSWTHVEDLEHPEIAVEVAVRELLWTLGYKDAHNNPHLADTPARVARMYQELLHPAPFAFTTFPNEEQWDQVILQKDIPFHSLCAHHMLPFTGVAHVAYIPGDRVVGLSKLARLVQYHSRALTMQEEITERVVGTLETELEPLGAACVIQARHQCMESRGARIIGAVTTTQVLKGFFFDDEKARAELMAAINAPRNMVL